MNTLVKVINDGAAYEAAPAVLDLGYVKIDNPSERVLNKVGYWPLEETTAPEQQEGKKIFDDGYSYVDVEGGKKVIHTYRVLDIVDEDAPELGENQILYRDYWQETDTQYIHKYVVLTVVDECPEYDAETQKLITGEWLIDEDAGTKTRSYRVLTIVDQKPELAEGQEYVDEEEYEEDGNWVKTAKAMTVVNNPPELEEGQQIVDQQVIDDLETMTRTFNYEVRYIVDERPECAENQSITCEWWDDDGVTRTHKYEVTTTIDEPPVLAADEDIVADEWTTEQVDETHITRTHVYTTRKIVDAGAPELGENEFIFQEYWDDDGTTRTKVYDVWTNSDEAVPTYDANAFRLVDLGVQDDPVAKTRGKKYFLKPIEDVKPADDPDGNFYYVFDYEEDTGAKIIKHYKKVMKIWRTFSKLKVEYALFQMGKLAALNTWIDSVQLSNTAGTETVSLRHFYDKANDLKENNPMFKPYFAAACAALGMTAEAASAMLDQCKADYDQYVGA